MTGILTSRTQPQWCPCCWDKTNKGAYCFADCAPFTFSGTGDAAALNGDYATCRSYAAYLPSWAQPTYTPVADKVYATLVQSLNSCDYYFIQYCRANASGNRGVSWVVEYFCSGDSGATRSHLIDEILDWSCTCDGARFAFDLGYTGTGSGTSPDFGCCAAGTAGTGTGGGTISTTCCPSDLLPADMVVSLGACLSLDVPLSYTGVVGSESSWRGSAALSSTRCIDFTLNCNTITGVWTAFASCHATTGGVCTWVATTITADSVSVICNPFSGSGTFNDKFGGLGRSCCSPASSVAVPFTIVAA